MAVRRSPKFRFDYFLRSLPVDVMGRRCEYLMRATEKEVEQLEKKAREEAGLPVEVADGNELSLIELKPFKEMQRQRRLAKKKETETEKEHLEGKVDELESQMKEIQDRLKELSKDIPDEYQKNTTKNNGSVSRKRPQQEANEVEEEEPEPEIDESKGAIGPEGDFVDFPEYNGTEPPKEYKKAFTHFCMKTRKEVKASLGPSERGNKVSYCSLTWL
jgi:TolA-binding protein